MIEIIKNEEVAQVAAITHKFIRIIVDRIGVECDISSLIITEIATSFVKDIKRLTDHQDNGISVTKYVGYWAFWIRKLKPVSSAFMNDDTQRSFNETPIIGDHTQELVYINEIISLEFAITFLADIRSNIPDNADLYDPIRTQCSNTSCKGSDCFIKTVDMYFTMNGGENIHYILYSMRFRTFGPHHYAMMLQGMLFSSCSSWINPV